MKVLILCLFIIISPAKSIPIVPSFTQGSATSSTRSTTQIDEHIYIEKYKSAYLYSINGNGVKQDGETISPDSINITQDINGNTYQWTGLDLSTKPNWTLTNPESGNPFQFTEVLEQPSLVEIQEITRTITSESVTETTTVFTQ